MGNFNRGNMRQVQDKYQRGEGCKKRQVCWVFPDKSGFIKD